MRLLCVPFAAAGLLAAYANAVAQDLYVTGFAARKLYHLGPGGTPVSAVSLPGNPLDAAVTADGAFLYVSQPGRDTVMVLRTSDDRIAGAIPTPFSPAKIATGNNDTRLYVANNTLAPPHVTIIDIQKSSAGRANAPCGSIDLSRYGAHSAYTVAAFGAFLAVGAHSGHVLLFDTDSGRPVLVAKHETGARIMHLLFSPLGTKIYALLATPAAGTLENGMPAPPGNLHVLRFPSLVLKASIAAGRSELKSAALVKTAYVYATDARGLLHAIDIGSDSLSCSTHVGAQLSAISAIGGTLFVADSARSLIWTVLAAQRFRKDRVETSIALEDRAIPTSIVVLDRGNGHASSAP